VTRGEPRGQNVLRIALMSPGLELGGGVARSAEFLCRLLVEAGCEVSLIDLATARDDEWSSRILAPRTWGREPKFSSSREGSAMYHSGSHLAEIEPLRYMRRRRLTEFVNQHDLGLLVAGTPAWANVLRDVEVPTLMQTATTTAWERASRDHMASVPMKAYRKSVTSLVTRLDVVGVRRPDHVLVINSGMLEWCRNARGDDHGVSLVPPGVDTSRLKPAEEWRARGPIVSVGRLVEPRKGWMRLIESYGILTSQWPGAPDLVLVGSGRLESVVEARIDELGIRSRVSVLRDVTDDDLARRLPLCSVFVQASFEEGLGLAALEGMACGLPVVSTRTMGSEEYVLDGTTGYMVEQGPREEEVPFRIADATRRVLQASGASMSPLARAHCVDHFSLDVLRTRFMSVVDGLTVRRAGGGSEGAARAEP
jgi:glycosyltransferase involved in cell wall biosynthesis